MLAEFDMEAIDFTIDHCEVANCTIILSLKYYMWGGGYYLNVTNVFHWYEFLNTINN